jgi:predicted HTH transcriptional regulator
MSIWQKPVDAITFNDVKAFCTSTPRPREGPRLDFKVAIPKHLANLLSAYANTLGGMLVLGVETDKGNEPKWPPPGLADKPGISEQITQICNQAVAPPLSVSISPNLPNAQNPGTVVVVVRIDESPEAPHTVDAGRKIYERVGNVNDPQPAHIDRIAHLITRRATIEASRERQIKEAIERANRHLHNVRQMPVRWV